MKKCRRVVKIRGFHVLPFNCSSNASMMLSECSLKAFPTQLGSSCGGLWLNLGALGHFLEPTWSLLGASWSRLGRSWAPLGPNLDPLGLHFEPPRPPWVPYGVSWVPFGASGAPLQLNLEPLGRHLDSLKMSFESLLYYPRVCQLRQYFTCTTPRASKCNTRALSTKFLVAGWRHMQH